MVKIYYANIRCLHSDEMAHYLEKLHKQRCEKVLRCKNEADKKRSLLAGLLLRYGLEQEGLSYDTLDFKKNSYGKPVLVGYENLHFSISHSGDYVMCGIADVPIGVDLEDITRRGLQQRSNRLTAIARKCFSDAEKEYLDAAIDWKEAFLKVWTRKECYGKSVGRGLQLELSQVDVLDDRIADAFWSGYWMEDYYTSIYVKSEGNISPVWIEWKP